MLFKDRNYLVCVINRSTGEVISWHELTAPDEYFAKGRVVDQMYQEMRYRPRHPLHGIDWATDCVEV